MLPTHVQFHGFDSTAAEWWDSVLTVFHKNSPYFLPIAYVKYI